MESQDFPVLQGTPVIRIKNGDGSEKVIVPTSVDEKGNYNGARELSEQEIAALDKLRQENG